MTQAAKTEQIKCPVCARVGSWPIAFVDEQSGKTLIRSADYHWSLCRTCGTAYPYPEPQLTDLQAYWNRNRIDEDEACVTENVWQERLKNSFIWARRTYGFVTPFVQNRRNRILDIACGLGATVAYFEEKGWDAEGIDADPNARQFHQRLGIRATIGQVENIDSLGNYDLISIAHAIYFISNPKGFVQRVRQLLNYDGLFCVTLSDLLSSFSNGMPGYVHTWYPTAQSLKYLLVQEGFEILDMRTTHGSIMLLAKVDAFNKTKLKANPRLAWFRFVTHSMRYRLIGRPVLRMVSGIKRILAFWHG